MVVAQLSLDAPGDEVDEQVEDPVEDRRDGKRAACSPSLATSCLATVNISMTPMEKASDVSLTSVMTSLVMEGMMRLTTWAARSGRTSAPRVAQDLRRLVLAARDGLDAGAVDLREVGGVVDDESHDRGVPLAVRGEADAKDVVRHEVDGKHLQHERGAAHDGDVEAREKRERLEAAHAREGHEHAEGQRPHERKRKDLQADEKPSPSRLTMVSVSTRSLHEEMSQRGRAPLSHWEERFGPELCQAPVEVVDSLVGVLLAELLDEALLVHGAQRLGDRVRGGVVAELEADGVVLSERDSSS